MQLRFATKLTSDEYVSQKGWLRARILRCPAHPRGGCGWARHGTYQRKNPPGARIARWYCKKAQRTFSLLPDCLAAHLPSTLVEVEQVGLAMEGASSAESKAVALRPEVELPGALRWVRRRVRALGALFAALVGLFPERLVGCAPTVSALRERLKEDPVLPALRELAAAHLHALPPPLGFGPRAQPRPKRLRALQQQTGPDPPAGKR